MPMDIEELFRRATEKSGREKVKVKVASWP